MSCFDIRLEAVMPEKNRFRAYTVSVFEGLPGFWLVELSFGRIGTAGRTRLIATRSLAEARQTALRSLRRRVSAPGRLGVGYAIKRLHDPQEWLSDGPSFPFAQEVIVKRLERG